MSFEPVSGGFAPSSSVHATAPGSRHPVEFDDPDYRDGMTHKNVMNGDVSEDETQRWRGDTADFDRAMDEHGPSLHKSLHNTEDLARGVYQSMLSPSAQSKHRKNGVRRSSTTSQSSSASKPRDHHTRHSSLNYHNGSFGSNGSATPTMDHEISLLIQRLATERQKTSNLQSSLTQAHSDLAFQTKRLEEAEGTLKMLKQKEEEGRTRRKTMEVDMSKMKEHLRFLGEQYKAAVDEIKKAQKEIDTLDEERVKAVREVEREKDKVRKLVEERKLAEAREEGYRKGLEMGRDEGREKGVVTGRKYGLRDGREAEKAKQKRAMMDLVNEIADQPDEEPTQDEPMRVKETYHVVDAATPGPEGRRRTGGEDIGFGRSRRTEVHPAVTIDPTTNTAAVVGLPVVEVPTTTPIPVATNARFNPRSSSRMSNDSYTHPPRRGSSGDSYGRRASVDGYAAPRSNSRDGFGAPRSSSREGYAPRSSSRLEQDNPNVNILSSRDDLPQAHPGLSTTRAGSRQSAPPPMRIDTSRDPRHERNHTTGQKDWGSGVVGHGPPPAANRGHARTRSDSGGRRIVTPPSISSQDRSTPLEQYDILNPHHGGRGSIGGGLRDQVVEMTPITEGSDLATPVGAYFSDAAMGVRPSSQQPQPHAHQHQSNLHQQPRQQEHHHQSHLHQQPRHDQQSHPHQHQSRLHREEPEPVEVQGRTGAHQAGGYIPPGRRSQPSPSTAQAPKGHWSGGSDSDTWRAGRGSVANQAVRQPRGAGDGAGFGSRKPPPNLDSGSEGYGRTAVGTGRGAHGRSQSVMATPSQAAALGRGGRSRGGSVSGGGIVPPIEVMASTPPRGAAERNSKMAAAGDSLMGSPSFRPNANSHAGAGPPYGVGRESRQVGPQDTPLASPQPHKSPLPVTTELKREDFVGSDPSGGVYHPRNVSRQEDRSPHMGPSPNIHHPTPRRYSSALDLEPEDIMVHPSGTTPTKNEFDIHGRPLGGAAHGANGFAGNMPIPSASGKAAGKKGKPSKEQKKRRREGFVDYDDEVPQIEGMGYAQDQEPPPTTRSRVQSMYGIHDQRTPGRSPMNIAPPLPGGLPRKTPAYEAAPLPLPKSARMMPGGLPGNSGGYGGQPVPSPQRSTTSSQIRRQMEDDLDTPIDPYAHEQRNYTGHERDHEEEDPRELSVDLLDRRADDWEPRSGQFVKKKLPPQGFVDDHGMEIVPPQTASPSTRPVTQDTSFLSTGGHSSMPPPSPGTSHRVPSSQYMAPQDFDDSNVILPRNPAFSMGDPGRSPLRQSLPVTASARSSAPGLPPVTASDVPWATGKTTTSQLPRQSTYEAAPPSTAGLPPNTAATWQYKHDSSQTVAPVGPIGNGGLGFTFGRSGEMPAETYTLASPSHPPGSTRANIMDVHGSTRSHTMNIPSTARSIVNPLPPSASQVMLERMLTPDALQERDEEPIVPKKKKGGKAKKK